MHGRRSSVDASDLAPSILDLHVSCATGVPDRARPCLASGEHRLPADPWVSPQERLDFIETYREAGINHFVIDAQIRITTVTPPLVGGRPVDEC